MALAVALVVVMLIHSSGIATAVTPLAQADVAGFSSRADAWTEARQALQDDALGQAAALAEAARAEQQRAEAQRLEAEATTSSTAAPAPTNPPTTRPPSTTAPPTTTQAPTTTPPPTTTAAPAATAAPAPGSPTAAQWEALRQCEASGNYSAVSANGRYRGAYQFSQATWDWVASSADPALVGVDPAAATPAQQDAVARGLWDRRGWAPWPHCGDFAAAA